MRVGDTAAAALFEALDVQLGLGPRALAVVGCLLCGAWLLAARRLGSLYHTRTRTGGAGAQACGGHVTQS